MLKKPALLAAVFLSLMAGRGPAFGQPELQDAMEKAQKIRQAAKDESLKARYQSQISPVGHAKPIPDPYDIYSTNCHTAANRTVCAARDKSKVGVLACGGDPTTSPAHHTANWMLLPSGHACIYNWGRACCWEDAGSPPNIAAGPGMACAIKACDDQYCDKTRCLPAGEKVEMPGPLVCTVIAAGGKPNATAIENPDFGAGRRPACLGCCQERASYWDGLGWTGAKKEKMDKDKQDFAVKCKAHCDGFFRQP